MKYYSELPVLFPSIQFSISIQFNRQKYFYFKLFSLVKQFYFKQFSLVSVWFFVYTQLNIKTVLFQAIQFSISTHFSSIWPIDMTLSGATTPGQSGPGSDDNKGVLCIPQSSSIIHHQIVQCHIQDTCWGEVLPLWRVAVDQAMCMRTVWYFLMIFIISQN